MAAEFLMLAKVFDPKKHPVAGMYVSEKLDGTRAFWDGGVSRGDLLTKVPWANIYHPKTGELKKGLPLHSTGLWSRYGNPIMAPDWLLNQLPAIPIDGELWANRGNFQMLRSIVAQNEPDDRWHGVHYVAFGSPSPTRVFETREIKGTQFKRHLWAREIADYMAGRADSGSLEDFECLPGDSPFEDELRILSTGLQATENVYMHRQVKLSSRPEVADSMLERFLLGVLEDGGEGVMLRAPGSVWQPTRTSNLLKLKPFNDSEATVVGYTSGSLTDKGSKLLGKIGALVVEWKGIQFELSGMTDAEREFDEQYMTLYAVNNPHERMPSNFNGKLIKCGSTVTFRYRELSDGGIPKEARYWRQRSAE